MDILQAKKEVIAAGLRLVEKGLIARTWGNVSCRVDENSFVITPSGKPYKAHPEAGFVIHTHQKFASIISATMQGIPTLSEKGRKVIGDKVLLGAYGLPGTKKLKKGVAAAIAADMDSKAVITARTARRRSTSPPRSSARAHFMFSTSSTVNSAKKLPT